jgi:hypothetical protein
MRKMIIYTRVCRGRYTTKYAAYFLLVLVFRVHPLLCSKYWCVLSALEHLWNFTKWDFYLEQSCRKKSRNFFVLTPFLFRSGWKYNVVINIFLFLYTVKPVLSGPFIKRFFFLNWHILRSHDYDSIPWINGNLASAEKCSGPLRFRLRQVLLYRYNITEIVSSRKIEVCSCVFSWQRSITVV